MSEKKKKVATFLALPYSLLAPFGAFCMINGVSLIHVVTTYCINGTSLIMHVYCLGTWEKLNRVVVNYIKSAPPW